MSINVLSIGRPGLIVPFRPAAGIAVFRTEYSGTSLTAFTSFIRHYQQGTAEVPAAATTIYCKRPVSFYQCLILSDSYWRGANSASGFVSRLYQRDFSANDQIVIKSYPNGTCEGRLMHMNQRNKFEDEPPDSNVIGRWRQSFESAVGSVVCLIRPRGVVYTVVPRETVTRIKPDSEKADAYMKTREVFPPAGPITYTIDDRLQWPT